MKNKKFEAEKFKLYFVLDVNYCEDNLLNAVESVIEGGCKAIQLRSKQFQDKDIFEIGEKIRTITYDHDVKLIINDRADLCMGLGADGVHLGQRDLPASVVRKIIGDNKIIGVSTHNKKELVTADDNPCVDYISVGPIFKSPTKPELLPVGVEVLDEVSAEIGKPLIAIGGIDKGNIEKLWHKNLTGVAVVSAILAEGDITTNTKNLINKLGRL